jgi:sirohydrochlorin cobaltochelatase
MDAPATPRLLLASCLEEGRNRIGQILMESDFTLRHADDAGRDDLVRYGSPADAREIARYDAEGNFRSLKTAPNLKGGWLLEVGTLEGMELALEFFYPSALGLWLSHLRGKLHPTTLRETLDRQTGMYRITQLLRDDQASELVGRCCTSEGGCLRTILWDLAPGHPITSLPVSKLSLEELPPDRIPLLCRELCNLVVAAARPIAKGNLPKKE